MDSKHFYALFLLGLIGTQLQSSARAAENLRLKDGISFFQDTDSGFPILANGIEDAAIEEGRPTFIFFGAAGDLNTNRQARRVVDLYKRNKESKLKFVLVDVDHPLSTPAKQLLKSYYQGYIPQEVILDKTGKQSWSAAGEVDTKVLQAEVDKTF